jgi:hypothetical protein
VEGGAMNIATEARTWALCPTCNGRVGTIDHLAVGDEAGAWFCDQCGAGWWLKRTADGAEHRPHSERKERTIVTLALPPQDSAVTFVLDGFRIVKPGEEHDGDAYFYDEHTCPTNWLRDVTEVRFRDSDDPHGLFRWVSTVPASAEGGE